MVSLAPMSLATRGSKATSATAWVKKMKARNSTARSMGEVRAWLTPSRMACSRRGRSAEGTWGAMGARQISTPANMDSTALSANTIAVPCQARTMPATIGPSTRVRLMARALRVRAEASRRRSTRSGTRAENTGNRNASPTPLSRHSSNSVPGVRASVPASAASTAATTAIQACATARKRLRLSRSASAPLARPSTNSGKVPAACTQATHAGLSVSWAMRQAAVTSCIHMVMLPDSQASHR